MAGARKIRIAAHIEVEWLDERFAPAICPNCGAAAAARQILDIDYRPPDAAHRFVLQICPCCTARFVDNTQSMDYASETLIEIGWNIYQVQLGAGVWPIAAPLARIDKPAGTRVLEIGGAYGFGLDFCIQARGWRGEGFDPSPLAAFGARELGLTIHRDIFTARDVTAGPWDVVIATELIEHLEHPPAFFAMMRQALAAGGMLVLTTPDAEWITPRLTAGALMPLLSPGAHLVLQTQTSLRAALLAAGFAHVTVQRDAMSLVAYASLAPFALQAPAAARAMFRRYLVQRAGRIPLTSDLRFGFAGRGLFEAANDADWPAAQAAWEALLPAARARFGLDLASIRELPAGTRDASLAELAQRMPLGLGMILFGRAMHLLGAGAARASLLPLLRTAGEAVAALQDAPQRSLTDGLSARIGEIIACEIPLCLVEAGDATCVQELLRIGDAALMWRGLVALVNVGALTPARNLRAALPDLPSTDLPEALQRNALLSLANDALAPGGETMRALDYADALRRLGEPAEDIVLAAFTRLVNAARYTEALAASARYAVAGLAAQTGAQKSGQDALRAHSVLDLAAGDPAQVASRFAGVEVEPAPREALVLAAFTGLVNAARYDAAEALARAEPCFAALETLAGRAADDARIAYVLLDLHFGRNRAALRRIGFLAQAGGDETVLGPLWVDGFVRLVNERNFAAAAELARDPAMARRLTGCRPALRQDALAAQVMLALQPGDDAGAVVPRLETAVRGGLAEERVRGLAMAAFVMRVNAEDFATARALLPWVEPALLEYRPDAAARDALFAAGILFLRERDDWRRSVALFARLRDGLVKQAPLGLAPDALFWPALRGEAVALCQLNRQAEAVALVQHFSGAYPGAPDDLVQLLASAAS